jgi:hypothetical protein
VAAAAGVVVGLQHDGAVARRCRWRVVSTDAASPQHDVAALRELGRVGVKIEQDASQAIRVAEYKLFAR